MHRRPHGLPLCRSRHPLPGALILSFDNGRITPIDYDQTPSAQITRRVLNDRERFLKELSSDPPTLFDDQS